MKAIFADTYYFIALLNPADKDHSRALEFTQQFSGRIHTTAWVFTELADGLCRPPFRQRVGAFLERFVNEPQSSIAAAQVELFDKGFALYRQRLDKEWSLTDCISFVAMQR
jgi:uncharacterized protein